MRTRKQIEAFTSYYTLTDEEYETMHQLDIIRCDTFAQLGRKWLADTPAEIEAFLSGVTFSDWTSWGDDVADAEHSSNRDAIQWLKGDLELYDDDGSIAFTIHTLPSSE